MPPRFLLVLLALAPAPVASAQAPGEVVADPQWIQRPNAEQLDPLMPDA